MIRRLLARLLPGKKASAPRIYAPDQHPVRADQLSPAARTVTRKLQEAGFGAFIVGGALALAGRVFRRRSHGFYRSEVST